MNPQWTTENLLPHFDWQTSQDAAAVWQGYLSRPHINPDLWTAIKGQFLESLKRVDKLGRTKDHAFGLLAYVCIHHPKWLSEIESKNALRTLPAEGRAEVARSIWQTVEGVGEKSEVLWKERIEPFLRRAWPPEQLESGAAFNLALAAICARSRFPAAVEAVSPLLTAVEHFSLISERLIVQKHPVNFPESTLILLGRIMNVDDRLAASEVKGLLSTIVEKWPSAREKHDFIRLNDAVSRHGLGRV